MNRFVKCDNCGFITEFFEAGMPCPQCEDGTFEPLIGED